MHALEKIHRRSLIPVFLTYFVDNFGLAIIYPIFTPLLLHPNLFLPAPFHSFFERTLLLGLLIGAFPFAQFFGAPLIGQFSDRFGRKRAFYCTILGTAIGYTMTAMTITGDSLAALFISRFMTGLFAGNLPLCLASVADMSPDEHSRAKNFGQLAAMGGLSYVIAIMMGGILSDRSLSLHFSPSFPFWVTAVLAYFNFGLMISLFQETHPTKSPLTMHIFKGLHHLKLGWKTHSIRVIYIANFFFMLAWVSFMQFCPTILIRRFEMPTLKITYVLALAGMIWSLSNLIINRQLSRWIFPGRTFLTCLFLLSFCLLTDMFITRPETFFLFFYPAVMFASLSWTNGLATVSLRASGEIQGSILGINQSICSVAAMLGPAIGGLLLGLGTGAVLFFAGISSLIGFFVLWKNKLYLHTHNHKEA